MQPVARDFYRSAIDSLEHARQHVAGTTRLDAAQVLLSLDHSAEMILKAALLERGESIMVKPGYSVGLQDALKRAGAYKNKATIEILRERRDSLQHLAAATDAATTLDLYEGAVLFVEEVLKQDFGLDLPAHLRIWPSPLPEVPGAELISARPVLQRDVHAAAGVVVWAEASAESGELAVTAVTADAAPVRLTPVPGFEYMPRTDGQRVAAYRQSGGIVLYDLASGDRSMIAETGAPTDVGHGFIAAQGLSHPDGVAGGIWLYSLDSGEWEKVSDAGDSARLAAAVVVWQEFDGTEMTVRRRQLTGGPVEVVAQGAAHPTPSGDLIAWSEWPATDPTIYISDSTGQHEVARGVFPHLDAPRLAFLRPTEGGYDLVVKNLETGESSVDLASVGFPTGGGPILCGDTVYFESRSGRDVPAIYRVAVS